MPLLIQNLIDVQVSELTEKARTNSKGWPGDPDFKFLRNAKMQSDSQKKLFSISKYIFLRSAEYDHRLKIKNIVVADQKQVLTKAFDIVACPV